MRFSTPFDVCTVRGGGGRVRAANLGVHQLPTRASIGGVLRRRGEGGGHYRVRARLPHTVRTLPEGVPDGGRAGRLLVRPRRLACTRN